jgi:TrmH family RNA methyltransferase
MVRAALNASHPVEAAFVCPELIRGPETLEVLERLFADGIPVLRVGVHLACRLAGRAGPDGLAAIAACRSVDLSLLRPGPLARLLVLDAPELAGNLGSLVRCADAAGACGVIVAGGRLRLDHPNVIRASMGTVFSMPVAVAAPSEALDWLRDQRFGLIGAEPGAPTSYRGAQYGSRVAIVLGSERSGLRSFWRAVVDQRVAIPMLGRADSLNVGHAGALLLYEALHRQSISHDPPRAADRTDGENVDA